MTHQQLLDMIDTRAAADAEFAALAQARNDLAVAAALSAGRTKPRARLITERGVISALGPIEGEGLLAGLEAFATATLPPEHPLYAHHAGMKRVLSWLKPPADGVDIGDPLTQQLLQTLVALGVSGITAPRVAALLALASVPDPISVDAVSAALNSRGA